MVKGMKGDKAHRADGFTISFFHKCFFFMKEKFNNKGTRHPKESTTKCWSIIKEDLLRFLRNFIKKGSLTCILIILASR